MFYSKTHSSLPRAIEEVNRRARDATRAIIALPPDNVDELTDEEELDDDIISGEDVPLEIPGSVEIEYENDVFSSLRLFSVPEGSVCWTSACNKTT